MTLRPCAKGELRSAVGESPPLDAPPLPPQIFSLLQLPADQRRVLAAKLREVQQDTSIDQGSKAEIASGIIKELRTEARASEDYAPGADPLPPSSTEEPSGVPELTEELKEAQGGAHNRLVI